MSQVRTLLREEQSKLFQGLLTPLERATLRAKIGSGETGVSIFDLFIC